MQRLRTWLLPVAAVVVLLAIWQIYVDAGGVSQLVLPSPHAVARALVDDRGTLWHNLVRTGLEILLGILVAAVFGFAAATVIHLSALARQALYPLLAASQAVPIVVVAPLVIVWLGFGLLPKLAIIGLVCFFPIVVTTLLGLDTVDPDLIKLMRTFDASRLQTFRLVELPSALPGLFTGTKLAAVYAVVGAVFAEQAGASSGLGYLLIETIGNLETAEAFATVFVLSAFAILLFAVLTVIERRVLPWAYQPKEIPSR